MPDKIPPMINRSQALIGLIVFVVFLSACNPAKPTASPVSGTAPAYPQPAGQYAANYGTPLPGAAYPAPEQKTGSSIPVVPMRLNKPVQEGAVEVSGSGPAGLPIIIADVTFMGEELGSGQIDANGNFAIKLGKPLEKDHRIGIGLGDLKGTQWEKEPFSDPGFFGDESMQIPMVGFFYDTAWVQPK